MQPTSSAPDKRFAMMHRSGLLRTAFAIVGLVVLGTIPPVAIDGRAQEPPPAGPATAVPVSGRPGGQGAGGAAPAAAAAPPLTQAAIDKAAPILAATREALGGSKLVAVKTLSARGQTRRLRGNNLVPILFELDLELPDKYIRRDESPAENTDPTSLGFNGNDLLQVPPPATPPARAGAPSTPPAALDAARTARVRTVKQDFVRFALGMFAQSFETYPLTFGYAAQAQAPQGTADVLDVRGADGFALRFLIQSDTHLPVMVSWTLPPTSVIVTVAGQPPPASVAPGAVIVSAPAPPPAGATQDEKDRYARDVLALRQKAQATPVEHRIYFADYRDVDGVKLPFRLRRAIGTDTTEETTFDRFQINPKIAPQKFSVTR
jgi:hypothetical protein